MKRLSIFCLVYSILSSFPDLHPTLLQFLIIELRQWLADYCIWHVSINISTTTFINIVIVLLICNNIIIAIIKNDVVVGRSKTPFSTRFVFAYLMLILWNCLCICGGLFFQCKRDFLIQRATKPYCTFSQPSFLFLCLFCFCFKLIFVVCLVFLK